MATSMKTPGVYVEEKNALPGSVVEVATAVPAFVGYTQEALNQGKSLRNKPTKITSIAEYHHYFGNEPPETKFSIENVEAKTEASISIADKHYQIRRHEESPGYLLRHAMLLFFQNGGGPCFVVSIGDYETPLDRRRLFLVSTNSSRSKNRQWL